MTLSSRAFFYEFLGEFDREGKKTAWEKLWLKPGMWTAKMLGTAHSRSKHDYGLIGRIGQKFHYEIEAEWRRIDQIWYNYLPKPAAWKEASYKIDVLVEHENNIGNLEFTLIKCEEIAVPLRVGVFYPEEEEENSCLKKSGEIISKQVASYPGGVYLIILGFLNSKKGVFWHGYEIDSKGNSIRLQ